MGTEFLCTFLLYSQNYILKYFMHTYIQELIFTY